MKQPKKLTSKQKKIISKTGYEPIEYMLAEEDKTSFTIVSKKDFNNGTYKLIRIEI